jgi:hypothetical protein
VIWLLPSLVKCVDRVTQVDPLHVVIWTNVASRVRRRHAGGWIHGVPLVDALISARADGKPTLLSANGSVNGLLLFPDRLRSARFESLFRRELAPALAGIKHFAQRFWCLVELDWIANLGPMLQRRVALAWTSKGIEVAVQNTAISSNA